MDKERPFSPENKETPPIPGRLDIIFIDGKFAQCSGGTPALGVNITFLEDPNGIRISPEEWSKYKYEKPPKGLMFAKDLVKIGLMSKSQLQKVHWGPEQEQHPYLRGEVTFFGTYTKKN